MEKTLLAPVPRRDRLGNYPRQWQYVGESSVDEIFGMAKFTAVGHAKR